jgi:glycosyltransferase involved in cell wall biosynthesis
MNKQNITLNPLISVIMPVYNAGDYLVEAIESIRNQSVSDWEFLIIDDGSTDLSWKIINRFAKKDSRIRIFQNKVNKGLVASLNSIIPKTRGKFVARMDADDISLPNRFEKQVALLEANTRLSACGGQEQIIDEQGKFIAEKYFPLDPNVCYNTIANVMVIQPPLLMARGDIIRKLRYDNHIFKNDDISIHFKLLHAGQFSNVDEVIFKYRRVPNSLTHKNPHHVYYLALLVRLHAYIYLGWRPSWINLILMIPESFVVMLLPNSMVINLFEFIRFTHEVAHEIWRTGISLPKVALAKAINLFL